MSVTTERIKLRKSSDQYVQMQQLLPNRFATEKEEHAMSENLISIIPYATLRMRNVTQLSNEDCANAIADRLQSSNKFMQNDPAAERVRMEMLRALPQCLTVKRSIKSQLLATVSHKMARKPISYWKWLKYNISLKFRKIRMAVHIPLQMLELWYQAIKVIESHSGSGIATYFKFLRWLLFLNIISCILSHLKLKFSKNYTKTIEQYKDFCKGFYIYCLSFIVIPQSLDRSHDVSTDIKTLDFLTGSGFFSHTILYYGFYSNGTVDTPFGTKYSIPTAYFLTLFFCYTVAFIVLSAKVISSYRKNYVETRSKMHDLYSNKIFCGWDYSISSPKTAALQSASIYKDLEELLAEMRHHVPLHWFAKCSLIIVQLAVTAAVIFMICGIGWLVWVLLQHHDMEITGSVSVMIVPVVITIIVHIFPTVISYLTSLEHYSNKRTELYVTVVRNHAVATIIFGVLFVFWIMNSTSDCWQTDLGEEIYRLIMLDFVASIVGACLQFTRFVLYKRLSTKIGRPTFDIARSTLNLIYNQTLFWIGFYFSPLMSLIVVVKMIFMFYIKKYELKRCYQRPSQPWRAAQTQTLFLALAFLSMTGVWLTIGYVIKNVKSDDCGPFRDHSYTWDFIVDGMLSLKRDSIFWSVISELTRPATGAAILVGMCIAVYCLRAKVEASKEMLHILSEMLLMQSQDKQFLMKNFATLTTEHSHCVTSASLRDEINLAQYAEFTEKHTSGNEEVLFSRRHNLPSTSFEEC